MKYAIGKFSLLCMAITMSATVSCSPISPSTSALLDLSPTAELLLPTNTSSPELLPEPPTETYQAPTPTPEHLRLSSAAFTAGGMIPQKYSRRSEDISPPLLWDDPPRETQSFALLVLSDPLADGGGRWIQWILYNIPAETRALPEGIRAEKEGILPDGSQHYKNSWGEFKYGGTNPPHASTFSYTFTLYALDIMLNLDAVEEIMNEEGTLPWIGASRDVLLRAMDGHILAQGELVGKYKEP